LAFTTRKTQHTRERGIRPNAMSWDREGAKPRVSECKVAGMSRKPLRTNFAVNLLAPLARIAIAMVTIPIYVRHVGDARYGVISVMWVLLGYFGFLDLGLSRAATNALAKLREAPQAERARVLLTTFALNLTFGVIGSAFVFLLGGYLLKHVISIPDALRPEVARSFPWIAAVFPMSLISGVAIGALESRERFLLANGLQIFGMSLTQIGTAAAAVLVSPSLTIVIPTAAVAQASSVVVILAVVYWLEGPFSLRAFTPREARALLGYGGWISVSNVISPLLACLDQFLIGWVIGVAAVTHYVVPMNLVVRSQLFPVALGRTFFPRMSSSSSEEARALAGRALILLGYGYAAVCGPGIILSPMFFHYWMGADFALLAAPVAQIVFLGAWINGLAFVALTLLQGQGRPDITGKLHMLEFLPFLGILWVLTMTFGIYGAAAAWSLRCTADALALFWASSIPRRQIISALRPATLLVASMVAAHFVGANFLVSLVSALLFGATTMSLGYMFSEDWGRFFAALFAQARGFGSVLVRGSSL
jgi:O-antigen/teichoic acid export membrane protein